MPNCKRFYGIYAEHVSLWNADLCTDNTKFNPYKIRNLEKDANCIVLNVLINTVKLISLTMCRCHGYIPDECVWIAGIP